MKTHVFILAGVLIATLATGQHRELNEIEVIPPTFKSEGPNSINEYLQQRIEFPATEIKWGRMGTVVLGFVVTPEGTLNNIHVINSISYEIDMEVIRALKSTEGKWTPGTIDKEAVEMLNEVAVVFKLHPDDNFFQIAKKHLDKGNQALFINDQPEKALKHFNRGINLLPNDETLLAVRGLCKYKLGDETGANRDWDRSVLIAKRNGTSDDLENMLKIQAKTPDIDEFLRALRD
jgi:tetratricopeptide (TPR) repeat protein